jgi:hypothetical protein
MRVSRALLVFCTLAVAFSQVELAFASAVAPPRLDLTRSSRFKVDEDAAELEDLLGDIDDASGGESGGVPKQGAPCVTKGGHDVCGDTMFCHTGNNGCMPCPCFSKKDSFDGKCSDKCMAIQQQPELPCEKVSCPSCRPPDASL